MDPDLKQYARHYPRSYALLITAIGCLFAYASVVASGSKFFTTEHAAILMFGGLVFITFGVIVLIFGKNFSKLEPSIEKFGAQLDPSDVKLKPFLVIVVFATVFGVASYLLVRTAKPTEVLNAAPAVGESVK